MHTDGSQMPHTTFIRLAALHFNTICLPWLCTPAFFLPFKLPLFCFSPLISIDLILWHSHSIPMDVSKSADVRNLK